MAVTSEWHTKREQSTCIQKQIKLKRKDERWGNLQSALLFCWDCKSVGCVCSTALSPGGQKEGETLTEKQERNGRGTNPPWPLEAAPRNGRGTNPPWPLEAAPPRRGIAWEDVKLGVTQTSPSITFFIIIITIFSILWTLDRALGSSCLPCSIQSSMLSHLLKCRINYINKSKGCAGFLFIYLFYMFSLLFSIFLNKKKYVKCCLFWFLVFKLLKSIAVKIY